MGGTVRLVFWPLTAGGLSLGHQTAATFPEGKSSAREAGRLLPAPFQPGSGQPRALTHLALGLGLTLDAEFQRVPKNSAIEVDE